MAETVNVIVGQGEDDQPWVWLGDPDEVGDRQFSAAVPKATWDAVEAARGAYNDAIDAIVEAAEIDPDLWRLPSACKEWKGHESPATVLWNVVIPASGSDDVWPLRPFAIEHCDTAGEAQARIAELPEEFFVHYGARPLRLVRRADLAVEQGGWPGSVSVCYRCGWERDEHAAIEDA